MSNHPALERLLAEIDAEGLSLVLSGIGDHASAAWECSGLRASSSSTGSRARGSPATGASWPAPSPPSTFQAPTAASSRSWHSTTSKALLRLQRLDGVAELHDLLFEGSRLVLVSTGNDRVVALDLDTGLRPDFEPLLDSGRGIDSWHLNCVSSFEGRLFATGFGREEGWSWRRPGAWGAPADAEGTGELFELLSGRSVVAGLSKPHSPRRWREAWVVANSGRGGLVVAHDDGRRQEIDCGGWTRGLVVHGDLALVGISVRRGGEGPADHGRVEVYDLAAGSLVASEPVGFEEVYELLLVPHHLVAGLRRGAASNALRILERAAVEGLWPPTAPEATVAPLPASEHRATIEAAVPGQVRAGEELALRLRARYEGREPVASIGDHAVSLGWYWDDAGGPEQGRCGFGQVLRGGDALELICPVAVPYEAGPHRLHLGFVQEGVAWFDGGLDLDVEVLDPRDQIPEERRSSQL